MQASLELPTTNTSTFAQMPVASSFKLPPPDYRFSQDVVPHYVTLVPKGRKVGTFIRLGFSSGSWKDANSVFTFPYRFRNEVKRCLLFVYSEKSFRCAQALNFIPLPYQETLTLPYRRLLDRRSRPYDPKPRHYNLHAYQAERKLQKEKAAAAAAAAAAASAAAHSNATLFQAGADCTSNVQQSNSEIRDADNIDILNSSQHSNEQSSS
jgi:hypothetical protein